MLSKSEFKALTGWSDLAIAAVWYLVDKNRDNQLTFEEFTTVSSIFNLLPKLDSNGDNVLTLTEVRALSSKITQEQFDVADKNDNGVLDCSDFLPSPEGEGIVEGTPEGVPEGQPEGVIEGTPEGVPEGQPEGIEEGTPEGVPEGQPEGVVEGTPEGVPEGQPEGIEEGAPEGVPEGQPEGVVEGTPEGIPEGQPEGVVEGTPEGVEEGTSEGIPEGQPEGVVEGTPEGEIPTGTHSADRNSNWRFELTELLRVIQLFNSFAYHCDSSSEDGYAPGRNESLQNCLPHTSDYNPQDWRISLTELLRLIQFFNMGGYRLCPGQEDGYCGGLN